MEMSTEVERTLQRRIVFRLSDEFYGVDIRQVKEIIRPVHITRVPKTASYVEGVFNLRGRVVPVLNLRRRFNIEESEGWAQRFLVAEHKGALVGLMVDAVEGVLEFTGEMVLPPPVLTETFNREFLDGIVKRGEEIVILLDIERLLEREVESIKGHGSG